MRTSVTYRRTSHEALTHPQRAATKGTHVTSRPKTGQSHQVVSFPPENGGGGNYSFQFVLLIAYPPLLTLAMSRNLLIRAPPQHSLGDSAISLRCRLQQRPPGRENSIDYIRDIAAFTAKSTSVETVAGATVHKLSSQLFTKTNDRGSW